MIRKSFGSLSLGLAIVLWSVQALAVTLYGTVLAPRSTSLLVELNPATGSLVRTIGPVGYQVNGLTWDRSTGTLYATTSDNDPNFKSGLLTINTSTGTGTPVGSGAGQLVNVVTANSVGQLNGWTEDSDDPVLWNKAAGTVAVLGNSGVSTAEQSLAFDNGDVLYLLNYSNDNLYQINTTTGLPTLVGSVTGIAANTTAHHGDFHPDTNRLYAISLTNDYSPPNPRSIYVIDITTRSVVDALPTVDYLHTLAFAETPPAPVAAKEIPTLGEQGLILLSVLLALAAIVAMRRRRFF